MLDGIDQLDVPEWHAEAQCAREGGWDLFFGENKWHVNRAVEICQRCPVIDECRSDAIAKGEDIGVWGGLTPKELRAERRRRRNV